VLDDTDLTVYLLVEDFGRKGCAYREADLETVIDDLLGGQYKNPVRVVAFNTHFRKVPKAIVEPLRARRNARRRARSWRFASARIALRRNIC
jgi:hypothetical protein